MADKEVEDLIDDSVLNGKIRQVAKLYAAAWSQLLTDFVRKAVDNDRFGTLIAVTRLAQLSQYCKEDFHLQASGLCESKTEQEACEKAARDVVALMETKLSAIFPNTEAKDGLPVLATVPRPTDGTLN